MTQCRLQCSRALILSLHMAASLLVFGMMTARAADTPWQEPVDIAFTAKCDGSTQRYHENSLSATATTGFGLQLFPASERIRT